VSFKVVLMLCGSGTYDCFEGAGCSLASTDLSLEKLDEDLEHYLQRVGFFFAKCFLAFTINAC
jgi:hypothetical protein